MLSVFMLSVIIQSNATLWVILSKSHFVECLYTEFLYANAECHYAECHCAECIMLSAIIQSAVILRVILSKVIFMLLSVIVMSVVYTECRSANSFLQPKKFYKTGHRSMTPDPMIHLRCRPGRPI